MYAGMADYTKAVKMAAASLIGVHAKPVPPSGGSATIGPAGGTVTTTDGRASLVVPAGALYADTVSTLKVASPTPSDPAVVPGTIIEVGPAGTIFH